MVIYIDDAMAKLVGIVPKQEIASQGKPLPQEQWNDLKGKIIKNIQKIDGQIHITLK
jgi:hypothetical protein